MLNIFDFYERKARVYPAILVALPALITIYSFTSFVNSSLWSKLTGNSVISVAVLIYLSAIVRALGQRIEPAIWKQWGGPPSIRFLRWHDEKIAQDIKKHFYDKLNQEAGCHLNKDSSDVELQQGFDCAKNYLRAKRHNGLWVKFNAEYGFVRNLMGSRVLWLALSMICSILCLILLKLTSGATELLKNGLIANVIFCLLSFVSGWFIIPSSTKIIAGRYAENIIFSFLYYGENS